MAIERLSFPHYLNIQAGIEMQFDDIHKELGRVLRRFGSYIRQLREGEYDLTPSIWEKHVDTHTLTVLDSGKGIIRLIPRYPDSSSSLADHEGLGSFIPGGRVIRIPEDQEIGVVVGPNRLNPHVCLYELILYSPGSNPL